MFALVCKHFVDHLQVNAHSSGAATFCTVQAAKAAMNEFAGLQSLPDLHCQLSHIPLSKDCHLHQSDALRMFSSKPQHRSAEF